MTTASWIIGSHPAVPETLVTVTVGATQEVLTFPPGSYYLQHGTGALSLVAVFATMLNTHSLLLGSAAFLTVSGRVRLTNGTAFTVDAWGGNNTLRDSLGFTAFLLSSTAHVAPLVSPLYWSPRKTESTMGMLGSDGVLTKDTRASRSAPGRVIATNNNTWFRNVLRWRFIHIDDYQQVPDVNGTWTTVWDNVVSQFRRFYLARNVTEDTADTTTAAILSTRIPATLPYVFREEGPIERAHMREIQRLELYGRVSLPCETAAEYT